jgi:hypothetical protein
MSAVTYGGRPSRSALVPLDYIFAQLERPTGASSAGQLVRPTIWAKPSEIGPPPRLLLLILISSVFALCRGAVVDRVALVVGKAVFTQSEVDDETRLSELESGKPLDLSAARRKEAAERLVDQQLLRDEMQVTGFEPPAASDAGALLSRFRQEHFASLPLYRGALARYGVTEDDLKRHLLWQLAVIRFTEERFSPLADATDGQSANRTENGAQPAGDSVDRGMEAWLKQQRADTRIVFKPEAFQ